MLKPYCTARKVQILTHCTLFDALRVLNQMEANGLDPLECSEREFTGHVNLACKELGITAEVNENVQGWRMVSDHAPLHVVDV